MEKTGRFLITDHFSKKETTLDNSPTTYTDLENKCYDSLSIPRNTKIIITINNKIIDNDLSLFEELSKSTKIVVFSDTSGISLNKTIEECLKKYKEQILLQISVLLDQKMGELKEEINKKYILLLKDKDSENNNSSEINNNINNNNISNSSSSNNKVDSENIKHLQKEIQQNEIEKIADEVVIIYNSLINQVKNKIRNEFPSSELPNDKEIVYILQKNNDNVRNTVNYFEGSKTNSV